ncbi:MAG: LysM peptidoglycan-binding domain-containing protein [Elusimicrobiota bacterium]
MRLTAIKNYQLKIKNYGLFLILIFNFQFSIFNYLYSAQQLQEIEVKSGDTLWGVANYYLKEPSRWPEILKFNNISADPNNVLPGMKLKIPVLLIREQLRSSTIISVTREVKMRRHAEMDWTDAKLNTKLYNKDGIRTLESSYTGIKSPSGNLMTIGPSSLVIIQPEEKSEETRLLSGEIRTSNIPIRTPTAFIMPKITPKTPIADYKTKVKEDQSTVVAVYKGAVDVTAKNKTITVPEGFSTEVKINLPPMEPKKLPPNIDFPADLVDQKTGSQISPQIKDVKQDISEINIGGQLSKSASSSSWLDITHYHIQIAKDKNFVDMAYDEIKPIYEKFDIKKVNISEGRYFWRVAYLDSSGAEGIISSSKEIFVDKTPPALKIDEPVDGTKFADKTIKIKGTAEAKSLVDINGAYVTIDPDGKFISDISLTSGENVIKVNSKDPSGNISTVSIKVYQTTEGGITQKKKSFFSTPLGIIVSIITISALAGITIVTIGG